jgi:hypothetical protein
VLGSGVTPGNPIQGHDLRHDQVTLFRLTETIAWKSQGKRAITKTRGGYTPIPEGHAQCAVRTTNTRGFAQRGGSHIRFDGRRGFSAPAATVY